MKNKILAILVCMLVAICSVFTAVASTSVDKQRPVSQSSGSQQAHSTLIAEIYGNRVIEVDSSGTIVWQKADLNMPVDAERLANGNTLITEYQNNRVIEVDTGGTIVWQYASGLYGPFDAERLANGNTLITDTYNFRVIEVDSSSTIVWELILSGIPADAERLDNGNTLITEFYYTNRVIEVDSSGTIVWQKTGLNGSTDAERINNPPNAPSITGETNGKTGKEYEYTFNATDPDGDNVKYNINWGDNTTSEWTEFSDSGEEISLKHTWSEEGTYNITAKAEDIHGAQGPEGTLTVTIPRNKPSNFNFNLFGRLFERFPNLFPISRYLLGLR